MGIQISSLSSIDILQSSDYFIVGRPAINAYKTSPAQLMAFIAGSTFTWTQNQIFSAGLKFTGSAPSSGYILTSDAAGNASWQSFLGNVYTADETTLHTAANVFSLLLAPVNKGGTGLATLTNHAVVLGQGTSNVGFATIGTAGRVLIDQGASADPAFTAISGDATMAGSGALTVASAAITYAKIQNVANGKILGNNSGGAAAPSELTLGASLAFTTTAIGINFTNSNTWGALQTFGSTNYIPSQTTASTSGATWDGFSIGTSTLTFSGSTNVTTATGVDLAKISIPTITSSSSLTVTNAATLTIMGAPAQGGSTTITNAYSLWVQAGKVRLDGAFQLTTSPTNNYVLTCDASGNGTWQAPTGGGGGSGTVTSVATDSTLSGGTITTTGTLGINLSNPNTWVGIQSFTPTKTLASSTSLVYDGFSLPATTLTLTGTTAITTASGLNFATIKAPTYTDSSSVTVTNAATLVISNAPIAAGSVTITNAIALWVQAGLTRFDAGVQFGNGAGLNKGWISDANGVGTWTNIPLTVSNSDTTLTISPTTGTVVASLNLAHANTWTGLQTLKISDTGTNAVVNCLVLTHDSSGSIASNYGTGLKFQGQDTTTADVDMCAVNSIWTTATHASRSSQLQLQTVTNAGSLSTALIIGSAIASATSGITVGGLSSTVGGIWNAGLTPSTTNYALSTSSTNTSINVPTSGNITLGINGGAIVTMTSSLVASVQAISVTENISNVSTDGVLLANTTAALVGSQQFSPRLHWQGQGWKTTSTAASQPVDAITELQPVQGAANPSANLVTRMSVNNGSYSTAMSIQSNLLVAFPTGILAGGSTTQGNNDVITASLLDGASGSVIINATNASDSGNGVVCTQFKNVSQGSIQQSYSYGAVYLINNTSTGGINNARGVTVGSTNNTAAGTIVSFKAFNAEGALYGAGGAITTHYGLYIEGLKANGAGTGWGVYQSDNQDKNYFAGSVGIGTSTFGTLSKLLVNPNLTSDNNAQVQFNNITTASKKVLVLQGIASQTGNLLECQDSSGNPLAKITGDGWLVNTPGLKRITGDATNATNTMSNLTDTTINVISGVTYFGTLIVIANNSTAAEGLKFDFNGGSATVSSIAFGFGSAPAATVTFGTLTSAAIGTAITTTVATTADLIYTINFSFVCNGSGTIIPRFAENSAHTTGTATVRVNSYLRADVSAN